MNAFPTAANPFPTAANPFPTAPQPPAIPQPPEKVVSAEPVVTMTWAEAYEQVRNNLKADLADRITEFECRATENEKLAISHEKELHALRKQLKQIKKEYTAFIYISDGYEVSFFLIKGDHTKYENVFCNWGGYDDWTEDEKNAHDVLADSLADLFYDDQGGSKHQSISKEQFQAAVKQGASVVTCGFIQ